MADIKKLLESIDRISEGSMASATTHSEGPKFTGKWKGTDAGTPGNKYVGGEGKDFLGEPYIREEDNDRKEAEDFKKICPSCDGDGTEYGETCVQCGGRGSLRNGDYIPVDESDDDLSMDPPDYAARVQEETNEIEAPISVTTRMKKAKQEGAFMGIDQISKDKQGNFIFRKGFFYRHGMDSNQFAERVSAALTNAGFDFDIIDKGEVYKAFRGGASLAQQSHWFVKVRINDKSSQSIDEADSDYNLDTLTRNKALASANVSAAPSADARGIWMTHYRRAKGNGMDEPKARHYADMMTRSEPSLKKESIAYVDDENLEEALKKAFEDYVTPDKYDADKLYPGKSKKPSADKKKVKAAKVVDPSMLGEGADVNEIAGAITYRMIRQNADVIGEFGPDVVGEVIEQVAMSHAGAEELGSSDISIMVKQVLDELTRRLPALDVTEASTSRLKEFAINIETGPHESKTVKVRASNLQAAGKLALNDFLSDYPYMKDRAYVNIDGSGLAESKTASRARSILQKKLDDIDQRNKKAEDKECPTCHGKGKITYKGVTVPCSNPSCTEKEVKESLLGRHASKKNPGTMSKAYYKNKAKELKDAEKKDKKEVKESVAPSVMVCALKLQELMFPETRGQAFEYIDQMRNKYGADFTLKAYKMAQSMRRANKESGGKVDEDFPATMTTQQQQNQVAGQQPQVKTAQPITTPQTTAQQPPAPKGTPTAVPANGQTTPPVAGQAGGAPVANPPGTPAAPSGTAVNNATTPVQSLATSIQQLAQPGAQVAAKKAADALSRVR